MFTGCGTALVTPFRQDLSLDESTLRRLIRRQIAAGINFLVPCGTTGESPTLSRAEHLRVVEITLEEAKGKVPVLAGAGGYNTHEVIELAGEIEALGADGILSVTPYYNKPLPWQVDLHLDEFRTRVNQLLFTINQVTRRQRQASAHFLLVSWVNVRRIADVNRHRQAGVGDCADRPPLRFANLRPARLDWPLLQRVVIRQRDDQKRKSFLFSFGSLWGHGGGKSVTPVND